MEFFSLSFSSSIIRHNMEATMCGYVTERVPIRVLRLIKFSAQTVLGRRQQPAGVTAPVGGVSAAPSAIVERAGATSPAWGVS